MSAKEKGTTVANPLTLTEFVKEKRRTEWREKCPICRLPAELRQQIVEARRKKHTRAEVIEWLTVAYKLKIAVADFDTHYLGKHDL